MTVRAAAFVALALLAGCTTVRQAPPVAVAKPAIAKPAVAKSAVETALTAGITVMPMPAMAGDAGPALAAFRLGCKTLVKAADPSGLTAPADWAAPCAAAVTATDPAAFFASAFVAARIGDGRGLDTGYFEPEIAASRRPAPGYAVPLYRRPPDLVEADLGAFDPTLAGKRIRGRIDGKALVPYADRAAVNAGAIAGRGLELAWAADPHAAFFLEIQGSGRLRLPDGSEMRIGYDGQNGHPYTAIGKVLRDRGVFKPGEATMAGILAWLRAHPAEAQAVLEANRSYVFFRDTSGIAGPVGSMGLALTPETSVAADPAFVPPGAPLWLVTTLPGGAPRAALMVAQDRGGAIKGANRLDIFFGHGERAAALAGAMSATGSVTLLLPHASAARWSGRGTPAGR